MWEILVVFLVDGVAVLNRKTFYPPMLGDIVELSNGRVFTVMQRTWRQMVSEHTVLDVVLKKRK